MLSPINVSPEQDDPRALDEPQDVDLTEQERDAPPPPEEDTPPARLQDFNRDKHRDLTASKAVLALLAILGLIIIGSFVLMLRIDHLEIHHIELWIFSLLALVTIVSRPIMRYLDHSAE